MKLKWIENGGGVLLWEIYVWQILSYDFFEPYPECSQIDLLSLSVMQLLIKFVYPRSWGHIHDSPTLSLNLVNDRT